MTGRNDKSGEETVEVVHEALIRQWKRLRQWIENNREKLIQHRKIEAGAIEWRDKGKSKDYLLGGKQLNEAKAFEKEQTTQLSLSALASEFIQKSIQFRRSKSLRTTALAAIPIMIAFMGVAPTFRKQSEQTAWRTIQNPKNSGVRGALETLSEGCWAQHQLYFIYNPLVTFLFGSCAKFYGVNLLGANLLGVNLLGANLLGANLSGAYLMNAQLTGAYLSVADLNRASLLGAHLNRANLTGANLTGANLTGANLSGAYLLGANLSGANLSGANLTGANLTGADLNSANLTGANLLGAKNLTLKQVKQAQNWEKAEYSKEFRAQLGLPPEAAN